MTCCMDSEHSRADITAYRREQAQYVRAMLAEQIQTLTLFERNLKARAEQDTDERAFADAIALAIGYLQKARDALRRARRE